jgi:hypothetical protein
MAKYSTTCASQVAAWEVVGYDAIEHETLRLRCRNTETTETDTEISWCGLNAHYETSSTGPCFWLLVQLVVCAVQLGGAYREHSSRKPKVTWEDYNQTLCWGRGSVSATTAGRYQDFQFKVLLTGVGALMP